MKKDVIKKIGIGVGLGLFLLPLFVMAAQQQYGPSAVPGPIIISPSDISKIISAILTWISAIVFTVSLIMLLYAAILFLTAGASEAIHTKAKSVLIYAIVGVAVAILAYSIKPFLVTLFGANFS